MAGPRGGCGEWCQGWPGRGVGCGGWATGRRDRLASGLADAVGEELFPGAAACGSVWGQVGSGADRAGGPAGEADLDDGAVLAAGAQVAAEERLHLVYLRPGDVG